MSRNIRESRALVGIFSFLLSFVLGSLRRIHSAMSGHVSPTVWWDMNRPTWPPGTVLLSMWPVGVPRHPAAFTTWIGGVISSS